MVNWSARLPLIVASFVSLAACAALDTEPANRGSVFEAGVFGDLRARQPKPVHASAQGLIAVGGTANGRIYGPEGTSQPGAPASGGNAAGASTDMSDAEAYRLNFEDADVKDVVRAVLGEALKLNYTINPDVTGTITVASAQPVARNDLLATLESVLAAQGFAMVKQGGSYNITSVGVNAGALDVGARTTPGYGVSVVPLRFVSVKTMTSLLGGFVADAEGIRIDSTRNALVISGPGAKRAEVVKTALSFDGDWMAGQSVGIFELKQSSPAAVVKELERIFDAANTANGVIQFQPIDRLKAVLVVSKNTTLIGRAGTWVRRLDGQASSVQQNVFVYRPQYRDASELAKVLSSLFSAGGSAGKPAFSGDTGLSAKMGASTSSSSSSSSTTDTGSNSSNQANSTEAPIDDVTGASSDGTGGGDTTAKAAPDVIDLTSGQAQNQPNIRISADMANNTVVTYTDQETYKQVLAALQRLDAQPYQVAIQATIAEVTLNDKLEYGVQYYFKDANLGVGMPGAGLAGRARHWTARRRPGGQQSRLGLQLHHGLELQPESDCLGAQQGHRRRGTVVAVAGGDGEPDGQPAGRQRRTGGDRHRHHRRWHDVDAGGISLDRHHPQGDAAHRRQRLGDDEGGAGDLRRHQHDLDAQPDVLQTQRLQPDFRGVGPDGGAGRPDHHAEIQGPFRAAAAGPPADHRRRHQHQQQDWQALRTRGADQADDHPFQRRRPDGGRGPQGPHVGAERPRDQGALTP